jgi:sugar phosphate permease
LPEATAAVLAPGLSETGRRARRRIAARLIPFIFTLYIVAFIDRVNVSFATLEMSRELGFSDSVFGFGAGIFFIGYFLLEIPGALIVERWSARRWIARIMITWGLVTVAMGFLQTATQFYWLRFLLGAAEAGFFPGLIVYLTHWFRYEDRAKAIAFFMAAIPVSNVIGSPLAGWLLGVNWYGLEGWRWLFIVEGIPAVALGVVTLAYLTDKPHQAGWLAADEREWIIAELERERHTKESVRKFGILEALRHRDVLMLAALYFFSVTGYYGYSLWLPTIFKRASGLSNLAVTILAALPPALGLLMKLANGWHSDRTGERRWHTALPLFLSGVCFTLAIAFDATFWLTVAMFTLAGGFLQAYLPVFWTLPTLTLSASAAAASIGFINSVGNLGGFVGPFAMGFLRTKTQSFTAGIAFLIAGIFLAGVLVFQLQTHKAHHHSESRA